jgi:hypothetical protein
MQRILRICLGSRWQSAPSEVAARLRRVNVRLIVYDPLMARLALILLLPLIVALGACAHRSDAPARAAREFQLDWQAIPNERGAVVRGQLLNPYGFAARNIHLLVEGVDAGGTVVTRLTWPLPQSVRSGERATFDIPVPDGVERYRVKVVTFDLFLPRGGR